MCRALQNNRRPLLYRNLYCTEDFLCIVAMFLCSFIIHLSQSCKLHVTKLWLGNICPTCQQMKKGEGFSSLQMNWNRCSVSPRSLIQHFSGLVFISHEKEVLHVFENRMEIWLFKNLTIESALLLLYIILRMEALLGHFSGLGHRLACF